MRRGRRQRCALRCWPSPKLVGGEALPAASPGQEDEEAVLVAQADEIGGLLAQRVSQLDELAARPLGADDDPVVRQVELAALALGASQPVLPVFSLASADELVDVARRPRRPRRRRRHGGDGLARPGEPRAARGRSAVRAAAARRGVGRRRRRRCRRRPASSSAGGPVVRAALRAGGPAAGGHGRPRRRLARERSIRRSRRPACSSTPGPR